MEAFEKWWKEEGEEAPCNMRDLAKDAFKAGLLAAAEIARSHANHWQKERDIYPDGDAGVEINENAMIACEHVVAAIRKEAGE